MSIKTRSNFPFSKVKAKNLPALQSSATLQFEVSMTELKTSYHICTRTQWALNMQFEHVTQATVIQLLRCYLIDVAEITLTRKNKFTAEQHMPMRFWILLQDVFEIRFI